MILSQPQIREAVERGEIRFDPPLEERQWHEASVDLRLGAKFTKLKAAKGLKVSLAHGARPTDVFQNQASALDTKIKAPVSPAPRK
jgi:deoxycytidine triphosphate deaminase